MWCHDTCIFISNLVFFPYKVLSRGHAKAYVVLFAWLLRRRTLEQDALKHIHFTCLGLGDSNYTRYMGVPRAFKVGYHYILMPVDPIGMFRTGCGNTGLALHIPSWL